MYTERFDSITKSFRLPKIDESGLYASPIQQFPVELGILLTAILYDTISGIFTEKNSRSEETSRSFKWGSSIAVMSQLTFTSWICVYKILGIKIASNLNEFSGGHIRDQTLRVLQAAIGSSGDPQNTPSVVQLNKDLQAGLGLDAYCYLSFFVSLFILLYYCNFILSTVFNFSNNPSYTKDDSVPLELYNPSSTTIADQNPNKVQRQGDS